MKFVRNTRYLDVTNNSSETLTVGKDKAVGYNIIMSLNHYKCYVRSLIS